MTANVLNIWGELIGIVAGGLIFLIFGVFLPAASRQITTLPGSSGPRKKTANAQRSEDTEEEGGETVRADGYIDSFAGTIEEAGGGPPLLVKIALVGIPVWMIIYAILNWSQILFSVRTFVK